MYLKGKKDPKRMVEIEALAQRILRRWCERHSTHSFGTLDSIVALTGDASSRRYFRLTMRSGEFATVILVVGGAGKGPLVSGASEIDQYDSMAALAPWLTRHSVAIPALLFDARDEHTFLVEDIGDRNVAHIIQADPHRQFLQEGLA